MKRHGGGKQSVKLSSMRTISNARCSYCTRSAGEQWIVHLKPAALGQEVVVDRPRKMDGLVTIHGESEKLASTPNVSQEAHGAPVADARFDQWLGHHLKRLYDPVADEPIPADLIRLLESRLR